MDLGTSFALLAGYAVALQIPPEKMGLGWVPGGIRKVLVPSEAVVGGTWSPR